MANGVLRETGHGPPVALVKSAGSCIKRSRIKVGDAMTIGPDRVFGGSPERRPRPQGALLLQDPEVLEHRSYGFGDTDHLAIDLSDDGIAPVSWRRIRALWIPAMEAPDQRGPRRRAVAHGRFTNVIEDMKVRQTGGANDQRHNHPTIDKPARNHQGLQTRLVKGSTP